jgi:arylformamidase
MATYDISMPIQSGMSVYKNKQEKQPIFSQQNRLAEGGSFETTITMNVHTGTHLDFPLHMMTNGQNSSQFDVHRLLRDVRVIDCGQLDVIDETFLQSQHLKTGEFILLKTKSSQHETFLFDFPYLSKNGASFCVKKKIAGVGIDALGIERDQPGHETHQLLMKANILILEGLRLAKVPAGIYQMIALPLSIPKLDALPVRAILLSK